LGTKRRRFRKLIEITINTISQAEWDSFVKNHPDSNIGHLYGWKNVVESSYKHDSYYIAASKTGKLVGILPLVHIQSRLFGRHLVSMPFLDTGGPLFYSDESLMEIIKAATEKASELRATVDLRNMFEMNIKWKASMKKVTMHIPLLENEDKMYKSLPTERRNRIKSSIKKGLQVTFHGNEAINEFYGIFAENMRDLGSPVHSKCFFANILRVFPDNTGIVLVRDSNNNGIGAGLYFRYRDILSLPWVSSLRNTFKLNPNIILYWELMKKGCQTNARIFDFGRSTIHSGTYEYKRQWGAAPVQLYWYYHNDKSKGLDSIDSESRKNRMMISAWKRLPLSFANIIGPRLRKSISL
jgi:FemAB-related protein (PEP-CTERM system-associated)